MNILITGANKGIGFEIARQLGHKGHTIFLACRNESHLNHAADILQAEGVEVKPLLIDVAFTDSIHRGVSYLSSQIDHLDVLINNAGMLEDRNMSLLNIPEALVRKTFDTNFFGPLVMIQLFYPLLKRGSRVINVSSSGGQITKGVSNWAPAYCMSKSALNVMTLQMAEALKDEGIAVNAMTPGWVQTDMGGEEAPLTPAEGAATAVWLATEAPITLTGKFFDNKEEAHL